LIRIENLSIQLGRFRLHEIDLTINEGEYLVLLGPTGAGKSVLIECILGILRPQAGRIVVRGQDVTALYPEERNIGYVPQDYMLFPNMTVERNLVYGLKARRLTPEEITQRAEAMLELLDIGHLRARLPLNLSGGERQRVALGRALITEPEILLLDEPLSALDANLRFELGSELRRVHAKAGGTFLHVCHDFEEAISVGDRWAVMHDGRIVQAGTPETILEHPKSKFVARFTRTRNIFRGCAGRNGDRTEVLLNDRLRLQAEQDAAGDVSVAIRPERVRILPKRIRRTTFSRAGSRAFPRGRPTRSWKWTSACRS
jgi:ABC-type Fe3+/spermidine/putrescine transport system ATPase subunit